MSQTSMFYGAKLFLFEKARELRNNMTEGEKILWQKLNKGKMMGVRFKPQHPINIFIADFYCHSLKLVIEVDGGIHNLQENKEYDIERTKELNEYGIKVIRYTNDQIKEDINKVVKDIVEICTERKLELKK